MKQGTCPHIKDYGSAKVRLLVQQSADQGTAGCGKGDASTKVGWTQSGFVHGVEAEVIVPGICSIVQSSASLDAEKLAGRHRGNTYMTSLQLVSGRRHGRVT